MKYLKKRPNTSLDPLSFMFVSELKGPGEVFGLKKIKDLANSGN